MSELVMGETTATCHLESRVEITGTQMVCSGAEREPATLEPNFPEFLYWLGTIKISDSVETGKPLLINTSLTTTQMQLDACETKLETPYYTYTKHDSYLTGYE